MHMKVFLVDGKRAYVGSANLTGAGAGAKHPDRRNFEAGMLSDDPGTISQLMTALDRLYLGRTAGAVGFGSILEPGEPGRGP
jgi:phosphatidylserine/phosphatidylglycerophosphate/cardiolipin synthase-like enzyme